MKITKNKRIYAATGSIDEMLNQFNKRIDELSASDITSSTDTDDDKDYIAALKNKISDKFKSKISSCEYDYDDENYYFTVTSGTDVYEYTVPKDDLIGDEEKDAEYICSSIEEDINEDKKKSQTVKSSQYSDDTEYDPEDYEGGYTEWKKLKSKPVKDPDGNVTDYNMWYNEFEDIYVFTLGDPNVYYPENSDTDWECEDYDEAIEWFNGYNGSEDEDYE